MEQDRTLKIVVGYLDQDRPSRVVDAADLDHRTAFVLDSYRAAKVDCYFDSELYAALIDRVRHVVGADRVTAFHESGESVDVTLPTRWRDPQWRAEVFGPEDQAKPFERVVFGRGPAVVAVAGHDPHWKIGGPEPYHDSYTVPVFTSEDVSETLIAEARVACGSLGAAIAGVYRGANRPRRHRVTDAVRRALRWISPMRPR